MATVDLGGCGGAGGGDGPPEPTVISKLLKFAGDKGILFHFPVLQQTGSSSSSGQAAPVGDGHAGNPFPHPPASEVFDVFPDADGWLDKMVNKHTGR